MSVEKKELNDVKLFVHYMSDQLTFCSDMVGHELFTELKIEKLYSTSHCNYLQIIFTGIGGGLVK